MTKSQNQQNQKKRQQVKKPEVNDFFTVFLSKKTRNLRKKMDHISELESKNKKGEELKESQKEAISKKQEVQDAIDDNERILSVYLEAYSKREENEPVLEEKPEKQEDKENEAQKEVVQEKELPKQVNTEE